MNKTNKFNLYDKLGRFLFFPFIWLSLRSKWIRDDISSIFHLIHKLFVNSNISTFLAFFYPMIFIGILSNVSSPNFMIMGIGSLIPIIIGVQVLPNIILNLKQSSILKRIGATSTKSSEITFSIIVYFLLVSLTSLILNLGVGIGIYYSKMNFDYIKWGELILSFFFGMAIGISLGMAVSAVIKKAEVALLIGLMLTLPGSFLSSEFLPPSIVNDWGPTRYIAFIFPQKITTVFVHASTNFGSIFDLNNVYAPNYDAITSVNALVGKGISISQSQQMISNLKLPTLEIVNGAEKLIAWILLPIEIIAFTTISIKMFKWGVRW